MMAEHISRREWLVLEIELAEEYRARHADASDPIVRSQVTRRSGEATLHRVELDRIDSAASAEEQRFERRPPPAPGSGLDLLGR
jgi:hypothetical protein